MKPICCSRFLISQILAAFLVAIAPASVKAASPTPSVADNVSGADALHPEGHAGWGGVGAVFGFTAAAVTLGTAIASDVVQSEGGDGTALGGGALATFALGVPVVALARTSVDGRGSLPLRIVGYATSAVAGIAGGVLLGTSLRTGQRYPPGLVSAIGGGGAISLSLLSIEALMARAEQFESVARPSMLCFVPTIAVGRTGRGTYSTLGVSGSF